MGISMMRFGGSGSMNIGRGRSKIWLALPVLGLMLAAIAMSGLQQGTAYAAEESAIGTDKSLGTAEGGGDSAPNGRPIVAESWGGMKVVWSATLTVGMATDGTTTYLGYGPGLDPPIGNLDDITFTDRGVEYTIDSLVNKEVGSINQLVLETSTGLPDDLIFEVDGSGTQYPMRTRWDCTRTFRCGGSTQDWAGATGDDDGEADATQAV